MNHPPVLSYINQEYGMMWEDWTVCPNCPPEKLGKYLHISLMLEIVLVYLNIRVYFYRSKIMLLPWLI